MAQSVIAMAGGYWFWGVLGFLCGAAVCLRDLVKNGCNFPQAVIAGTAGLYGGLLGARTLYFLIFDPLILVQQPISALAFWQGTGTWLGGLLPGAVAVMIVLKAAGRPVWSNLGSMAPGLALGHALGRVGCLAAGCCGGAPAAVPWAIYSEKLDAMVHPTQIYSMLGELISFLILRVLWARPEQRRYLPAVYGMLLAGHRFISESFRDIEPGPVIIPGLTVYQALCVLLFTGSLLMFVILKWKKAGRFPALVIVLFTAALTVPPRLHRPPVTKVEDNHAGRYLVITRQIFDNALDRWTAERRKGGFDVVIRAWHQTPTTEEIREWIARQNCKTGQGTRYVLIVGDCGVGEEKQSAWHVPSIVRSILQDQATREFVTDGLYGDLDGDGVPDVPVGRLAVRSIAQLTAQIRKIGDYQNRPQAADRVYAVVWTGAAGYASEIRHITGAMIRRLPEWIATSVIDAESRSFCLPSADQPADFLDGIGRSPFLSLVASHGSYRSITTASRNGNDIFISVEDVARMSSQHPSGAMFLLGCDSGRFNTSRALDISLAEAFADHPGGPVGVVAATAATDPLTSYFFVGSLIDQINQLDSRKRAIGDFLLGAQRRLHRLSLRPLAETIRGDRLAEQLLLAVPDKERKGLFAPGRLYNEILMYNLLGDPSCELRIPRRFFD